MTMSLEILTDGERPVVVKRATGDAVAALRAEGDRLAAARHPGVVQLLTSEATAAGWEVRTVHAGRALDVLGVLSSARVAAVAAGAAATLADLHAQGIVHGRVETAHILLGDRGRPVLCGFGASPPVDSAEPADDVAGIGALLVALLGVESEGEPIPERRWARRRGWTGWERRALLTLADQACAEPASRRPTARRLAAAIAASVPEAGGAWVEPRRAGNDLGPLAPVSPEAPASPPDALDALRSSVADVPERARPRLLPIALAALGVAALVVGVGRSGGHLDPSDGPPDASTAVAAPVAAPSSTTASTAVATTTAPSAPPTPGPCGPADGVDLDADGCREPVVVDGAVVAVGNQRFQVGSAGDEIAVRDWDCDGEPTPALLRPGTGEVFVFARWNLEDDVVVRPVTTVAGATQLVFGPPGTACSGLSVRTADDRLVEIVRAAA